jgi:hypothetical protein
MSQKDNIIVSANIFRFLSMHVAIGFLLSLFFGLIWKSFIESIIILSAVIVSAIIGFFLIDANEKNIVLHSDKIEGPTRSSIFTNKRISVFLKDVDLSLSKNNRLLVGNSYIASVHGEKVLLDKKFLSDEQVRYIFNILNKKLTKRLQSVADKPRR